MNLREKLTEIVRENLSDFYADPDSTARVWLYADGRVRRASWDESWDGTGIRPVILPCLMYEQDEESGVSYGPDDEDYAVVVDVPGLVATLVADIIEAIGDDTEAWTESLGVTPLVYRVYAHGPGGRCEIESHHATAEEALSECARRNQEEQEALSGWWCTTTPKPLPHRRGVRGGDPGMDT